MGFAKPTTQIRFDVFYCALLFYKRKQKTFCVRVTVDVGFFGARKKHGQQLLTRCDGVNEAPTRFQSVSCKPKTKRTSRERQKKIK